MQFQRAFLNSSSLNVSRRVSSRQLLQRSFATTNLSRMSSSSTLPSTMGGFTSSLNSYLRRDDTSAISNGRVGVQSVGVHMRLFSTIPSAGKLGLGGYKWSQMEPTRYYKIVQTALESGMTVLEAGQEGGDAALAEAYEASVANNPALKDVPVTVLARIGYRTILPPDVDDVEATDNPGPSLFLPHDIQVEKHTVPDDQSVTEKSSKKPQKVQQVVHNI
jgi:hypothetical protein